MNTLQFFCRYHRKCCSFPDSSPDAEQEQNNGTAKIPSHQSPVTSNPREKPSLAKSNQGQESYDQEDPSLDFQEDLPPLQKTISSPAHEATVAPAPIRGVLKNSGMLPPVVPRSPQVKECQSPHRRIKKLHRSKTVENADLNGHEHRPQVITREINYE